MKTHFLWRHFSKNDISSSVSTLDPYREYYRPDIFTFGGDKIKFDFPAAGDKFFLCVVNVFMYFLYYSLSESVGKLFRVYRIKLTETVDLEKDQEAKCRKVAEKELELILEEIETICQIKEFELNDYSMYLVNESFKKNEK